MYPYKYGSDLSIPFPPISSMSSAFLPVHSRCLLYEVSEKVVGGILNKLFIARI